MTACERCSRPFVRRRLWAKFCTSACRISAWKERNRTQGEAAGATREAQGIQPDSAAPENALERMSGPLAAVARDLTARVGAGTFDGGDPETRAHLAALRTGPTATG